MKLRSTSPNITSVSTKSQLQKLHNATLQAKMISDWTTHNLKADNKTALWECCAKTIPGMKQVLTVCVCHEMRKCNYYEYYKDTYLSLQAK